MTKRVLFPLGAVIVLTAACDGGPPEEATSEPEPAPAPEISVYAGAYPLAYFAERIGGDRVQVELPVPEGADPARWTPDPETVLEYQEADLVLLNGAEYEEWTGTASLPAGRVVDTSAGFEDRIIYEEDAVTHSHGPEGEHTHGETASVTWLDPQLALEQARAVHDALTEADPEGAETFREGLEALEGELEALDAAFEEAFAGLRGERVFGATPTYHYLARRYGMELETLRFDAAEPMGHDFWHDLDHALAHGAAAAMLWEEEPPSEVSARLDELGIDPVVFDPASVRPGDGDFGSVMEANRERVARR